jgi:hypothetical protein
MLPTVSTVAAVVLIGMGNASAAPADDACATLLEVRGHLLAMIDNTDHAVRDDLKRRVYAASAQLESIVGEMADNDADKAKAFRPIWEKFKKTREKEIIPAVYAGRKAYAKTIAGGIQAVRMGKMKVALGCM